MRRIKLKGKESDKKGYFLSLICNKVNMVKDDFFIGVVRHARLMKKICSSEIDVFAKNWNDRL